MAHFRFPLSVGADGKRTSTHVSVNPYAISFQTNDATPVVYDGHEEKVIDLTALFVAAAGKLTNARTIGISGAVTGTATNFDGTGNITIPTTAIDVSKANAGTLAIARGGTGKTSWTAFGIVYASAKNTLGQLGVGTAGQVLQSGGSAAPSWVDQADLAVGEAGKLSNSRTILVDLASTTSASFDGTSNITPGISNTLPTTHGGTGKTAWDSYKIIYASGSNTLAQLDIGSEGQVLLSQGTGKTAIWDDQSNLNVGTAAKFTTAKAVTLTGDVTGTASSQAGWSITTTIGAGKVTNAMLAGSIANAKLANSKITIAGNDVSLGGSLAASTLVASLGLSTAMHFIGVATVAITDGSTTDPTISGYSTKTAGDVIIDKDSSREYVWSTTGKWELLGGDSSYKVVQSTVDSGAAVTNKWVSRIQQNANGVVTVTMGTLDTSGTWSGNAASATSAGKWTTARTLTIGNTGKSVNGSSNVSWTLAEIGAAPAVTGGYLPLSGGTMTGPLTVNKLHGTLNADYGETLPLSATEGQIFFQISDPWYELPDGGTQGQVLAKKTNADHDLIWDTLYKIPAGGTAGQALVKNSATDGDVTWGAVGGIMRPNTTTKYYVTGSTSTTENTDPAIFNTAIYVQNSVLFGAAWNDYAEYRNTLEKIEPGRCVVENGTDSLILSTGRMQAGAEIISDTFGFAIGQTEKCNTPIAVTGRVLAFPFENLNEFKPGRPVCSGPNGTVSLMTDEEARQYPWCIIGTVSAIPQEKTWGSNNVSTVGRVWIRVR